jgi:hypothetical protein
MYELLLIALIALAIENLTDILTTVDLLEKQREWFRNKFPKVAKLATCNYCQTWWLSGIAGLFLPLTLVSCLFDCEILGFLIKWIVLWLVIARTANFFGVAYAVGNSIDDFLSQYINGKNPKT